MKTRVVLGVVFITFLLSILPDTPSLANTVPMMSSAVPVSFPRGAFRLTTPYFTAYPAVVPPQVSRYPLISAQQACLQGGGWNWRRGSVPMCFKSGHDVCPGGYPWMRQMTQKYTICLSTTNPVPPKMGVY